MLIGIVMPLIYFWITVTLLSGNRRWIGADWRRWISERRDTWRWSCREEPHRQWGWYGDRSARRRWNRWRRTSHAASIGGLCVCGQKAPTFHRYLTSSRSQYIQHVNAIKHFLIIYFNLKIGSGDRYPARIYHRYRLLRAQNNPHPAIKGWQIHWGGDVVRAGGGHPRGRRLRVPRYSLRSNADQQSSMATRAAHASARELLERHSLGT